MAAQPAVQSAAPAEPRSGLQTIIDLLPYLWPKGDMGSHIRVVISSFFLVAAKGANVLVPLAYAAAVDALAEIGEPAAVPALKSLLERFPGVPFLDFAVHTAIARIGNGEEGA